jgi:hypothetical protein
VAEVLLLVVVAMSTGTNSIDGLRNYMVRFFPWSIPGTIVPTRTYFFGRAMESAIYRTRDAYTCPEKTLTEL